MLDQLCAPLCDAVVGEPGAQERLRNLEASSLFLVPLDRRREWYRYHGLFREFLLGELRRVEPDVITKLHLRAADWYESNGSPAMAVEHLLNTDERDRCVQLVTALVLPTYQAGQISTVQRWLSALGDAAIAELPAAGRAGRLDRGVHRADRRGATVGGDRRRRLVRSRAARTARRRSTRRGRCCGPVMCPPVPSRCWPTRASRSPRSRRGASGATRRSCMHAEAHLLTGDVDQAAAVFAESSTLAAAMSNTDSLVDSEAELAVLAMDRGRWAEAAEHLERALGAIDEYRMHDYPTSVLAFAAAARLAVHRGDLNEAEPPADPGDASPSVADVRAAVSRRARPTAAGQGVLGSSATR